MHDLCSLALLHDQDVVTARQYAAHIASLLGFDPSDQTRIATAVSEIVRNAFRYAVGGRVVFQIDDAPQPQQLLINVSDRGHGIAHLDEVLTGRYRSRTGLGMGIAGARRLMDGFEIESSPAGTSVVLRRNLPPRTGPVTRHLVRHITDALSARQPHSLVEEFQRQNQELLRTLDELQRKQEELLHLNRELEDTNRGVVALYAELDERADHLRRADEMKSRFLSNMTHEFRTPVNSIIGLCNLLVDDRASEGRPAEPEVHFIRESANQLLKLVNDLLDLAKVEAGKSTVVPEEFEVAELFGALRGMLRPLLLNQSVSLVFEPADELPPLCTDQAKVSQILRNLVSNALKFTERGEVRVSAAMKPGGWISFSIHDTGIGIAPEDTDRVFEEFTQIEHPLQKGTHGTGLGLPLSRRLAELLGGSISVESTVGVGSSFEVDLPARFALPAPADEHTVFSPAPPPQARAAATPQLEPGASGHPVRVLIVDDQEVSRFVMRQCLSDMAFECVDAATASEGERLAREDRPDLILLDLALPDFDGRDLLDRLRRDGRTAEIPVVVVTSMALEPASRANLLEKASAVLSKSSLSRDVLSEAAMAALGTNHPRVTPEGPRDSPT